MGAEIANGTSQDFPWNKCAPWGILALFWRFQLHLPFSFAITSLHKHLFIPSLLMGNNYTLKPVQWEFADIIKYIEIILIITLQVCVL